MIKYDSDKNTKSVMNKFQILYICSAARSGSTLTDMFMGGHSQCASLGELNFLAKGINLNDKCSCGTNLCNCFEWLKIYNAIKRSHQIDLISDPYKFNLWDAIAYDNIDYTQQTKHFIFAVKFRKAWLDGRNRLPVFLRNRLPIPPSLLKAVNNKMALYNEISRSWGKSVIVDSSKNVREAVELYERWPNTVKIVLLIRDGRGVYFSRRSSGYTQSESIAGWLNYYRRALPALDKFIPAESLLKIRYEDLATNPENVGQTLCHFINIPFEPTMLDLTKVTRHLVGGNNTRFASNKEIKLDTRWQTELLGEELDFFMRTGGNMNRQLGY